ncbi:hypothetical protein TRVA0_006S03708 [Trichomonascus vanleenenianus]|uniref:uncharacterized protein n=1 Tax=Trichomonascus vanleenenianus TaxID=2268995 RepID=UPI003ECB3C0A
MDRPTNSFTRYDPNHLSSDEEQSGSENEREDFARALRSAEVAMPQIYDHYHYHRSRQNHRTHLTQDDIELLTVIAKTADRRTEEESDGEPDFNELYHIFSQFMKANQLLNTGRYYQCLTTIIKLCSYDNLRTWNDRLNRYVSEYSVKSRLRHKRLELGRRYKTFQLQRTGQYLKLWISQYNAMVDYDEQISKIARARDHKELLQDAMRCWMYRSRKQLDRLDEADKFHGDYLKRRMLELVKKRIATVKRNLEIADTAVKRRALRVLATRFEDSSKLETVAKKQYDRYLKSNFLYAWIYKSIEDQLQLEADERVLRETFRTWRDRLAKFKRELEHSAGLNGMVLKGRCMDMWIDDTTALTEMKQVADQMAGRSILKRYLDTWVRSTDLSGLGKPIQVTIGASAKRKFFDIWKFRLLQYREAARFERVMTTYRVVKQWRLNACYQKVVTKRNTILASETLKRWTLLQREKVYRRYRDGILTGAVVHTWKCNYAKYTVDLEEPFLYIQSLVEDTTVRSMFSLWRDEKDRVEELTDFSDGYRCNSIKQRSLNCFFRGISANNERHLRACALEQKNIYSKIFTHWKRQAVHRKETRLNEIYRDFKNHSTLLKKQHMLNKWLNRTLDIKTMTETAESMRDAQDISLAREILSVWGGTIKGQLEEYKRADEIYNQKIRYEFFTVWITKHEECFQLHKDAEFMAEIKVLQTQEHLFRKWCMERFKIKSKTRDAKLYYEQLQQAHFKRMFRLWLSKTRDAAQETKSSTDETMIASDEILSEVLETPSRVLSRKKIGFTSVDRWKKIKNSATPVKSSVIGTPQTSPTRPRRLAMPGSSLKHFMYY